MSNQQPAVSNAFQTFLNEAPQHAQAWMHMPHLIRWGCSSRRSLPP